MSDHDHDHGHDHAHALPAAHRHGGAEDRRLDEDTSRKKNWKRWGPYLSERQWGTVREDYSADGNAWDFFPHDHARSRVYRWGEDGLLGITDRECRLCFSLALWNGRDPILKERIYGLTGSEGNHGEDVKEEYFYLDCTPTHSYMKALYKYPLTEYPYAELAQENRRRGLLDPEYEITDTGVFEKPYADVTIEYAKGGPDDILVRITVENRGREAGTLDVLPQLWFRNIWGWGRTGEEFSRRPQLLREGAAVIRAEHPTLPPMRLFAGLGPDGRIPELLFTDNETNTQRLWSVPNESAFVKDGFHEYVVNGRADAVNPAGLGTKAAVRYHLELPAGGRAVVRLRLCAENDVPANPLGPEFDETFAARLSEADAFYASRIPEAANDEERRVMRQGYAGLLWTKQFFHYVVEEWLEGDPSQPAPPPERKKGRNSQWRQIYNRDVISMPDKWEYPWYAAWDLAFHMVPFAEVDPQFAKDQLVLFLREWYMHPSGQLPAYEWALGDVNPPVHAWACWRVYKMTGPRGGRDHVFLCRVFQKLLLNFTWWVNRKDEEGKNIFGGGFLGLDNIGVFDRSKPLPTGGHLEQADGTAWMAFYCTTMMAMAMELARENPAYEDMASKFFEHFVAIADAMNHVGGDGLWDERDGFYYDELHVGEHEMPLRVRSMVGLVPLFAVEVLEDDLIDRLPGFKKRLHWFLDNRKDLAPQIAYMQRPKHNGESHSHRLLAIPSKERLLRVLRYMLDENEFLSPHGIRSLSRFHKDNPYVLNVGGEEHRVDYVPAEGSTRLFGGNSNWRGPVWFPMNYLLVESLERYHHFYGDSLKVECPTGSGRWMNLGQVAREISSRLSSLFLPDASGRRPCHGDDPRWSKDPHWKDLVLFHEYFHGDTGRGVGATHQTGWTSLAVRFVEDRVKARVHHQKQQAAASGTAAPSPRPTPPAAPAPQP